MFRSACFFSPQLLWNVHPEPPFQTSSPFPVFSFSFRGPFFCDTGLPFTLDVALRLLCVFFCGSFCGPGAGDNKALCRPLVEAVFQGRTGLYSPLLDKTPPQERGATWFSMVSSSFSFWRSFFSPPFRFEDFGSFPFPGTPRCPPFRMLPGREGKFGFFVFFPLLVISSLFVAFPIRNPPLPLTRPLRAPDGPPPVSH